MRRLLIILILLILPAAGWGADLLLIGGGESTSGWTTKNCTVSVESGGQSGNCLKVNGTSGYSRIYNTVAVGIVSGETYTYTVWFKKGDNNYGAFRIGVTEGGTEYANVGALSDATWTEYTNTFEAVGNVAYIRLYGDSADEVGYSFYDSVTIDGPAPWSAPEDETFYLRSDGEGDIESAGVTAGCSGAAGCSMNATSFIAAVAADSFGVNSTVSVAAGTYNMAGLTGTLAKEITLTGAGATTIFQNAGTITFTKPFHVSNIKYDTHSTVLFQIDVDAAGETADDSNITGCTFINGSSGILAVSADSNQSIDDITISNNSVSDYAGSSLNLFTVVYGTLGDFTITGNTFEDIDSTGSAMCVALGSNTNDITSATVTNNSATTIDGGSGSEVKAFLAYGDSISVDNFDVTTFGSGAEHEAIYLKATNSEVKNCTLTNCYSDDGDITFKGEAASTNNTVTGNIITSTFAGKGIMFNGSGTISRNIITRNAAASVGIQAYSFSLVINIINNRIFGTQANAITLDTASGGLISGNTAYGAYQDSSTGFRAITCSGIKAFNNTFANYERGIYLDSTTTGTYYNNICVFNKLNDAYIAADFAGTWDYNCVYGAPTPYVNNPSAAHDVNADPKFIGASNFHLQATSPCINAGISPFSDGDGDQYDFAGNLIWSDTTDGVIGAWSDGVEIGAYGWFGGILLQ